MDYSAVVAGADLMKLLGRENARTLLDVLELPRRRAAVVHLEDVRRDDGQALAEILADIEEDLQADAGEDESRSAYRARLADSV